jgi:drug/metabolite transporter (DMT)-like permease
MVNPDGRSSLAASAAVAACGAVWGLYWLPMRYLQERGLPGNWVSASYFIASLPLVLPLAYAARRELLAHGRTMVVLALANGAVFSLYSNAYVHTSIFNVLFLFYLSPVWSVLIARFHLGERVGTARMGCVALGLAGLAVMLGADGGWPIPRNSGDWMALGSGIIWAFVALRVRRDQHIGAAANTVAFFLGGIGPAVLFAAATEGLPSEPAVADAVPLLLAVAWLGWVPSQLLLFWGARRISPVRTGILLMTELLSGAGTAVWFSGDPVTWQQIAGGALILTAGLGDVVTARESPVPTPIPVAGTMD